MGEHYRERKIVIRLDKLEKLVAAKSAQIDKLNSKVANLEAELESQKSARNETIKKLSVKIANIQIELSKIELPHHFWILTHK